MSNLALSVGSALIGPLDEILEFHEIFYVIVAIDLAMLGLLVFFNLEKHKASLNAIVGAVGIDQSTAQMSKNSNKIHR